MIEKRHMGVIVAPHRAEVHTEPIGVLKPTDLLLKMETNNICTTDYQHWMGLRNHQGFPMAGGHEWSAIVLEKGAEVTAALEVGDRVAMCSNGCGMCDSCRAGLTSECKAKARKLINGYYGNRGFSNYRIVDQKDVLRIANDIPPAEAGFLEPVSTVVSGIKKARVVPGETIVVLGAGTMGLLNAQVAHAYGAQVIMTEISEKKLDRASSMGIAQVVNAKENDPVEAIKRLTGGRGADVVIPAVGNSIAYQQAYQMLKPSRGRMLLFAAGYPEPELPLHMNELHYRRIEIIGTMNANVTDYREAASMISNKRVCCRYSLEGQTFGLKDIQKAYEAAALPDTYRITVDLQDVE